MSNEQFVSVFVSKITELMVILLSTQFEDFSKELLQKINNNEIKSIDDIRSIWNFKCNDNSLKINNSVVSFKSQTVSNIYKTDVNDTCTFVLNKGKNKGKKCVRKNKKNEQFCYYHSKKNSQQNLNTSNTSKFSQNKIDNDDFDEFNDNDYDEQIKKRTTHIP